MLYYIKKVFHGGKVDNLICVDLLDREIGRIDKVSAHKKGVLHRAFSVVLYHDNKILIQKRASHKYHSGGLWANTCCSHPRTSGIISDAKERLQEEVGIIPNELKELFSFVYFHEFNNDLYEYEYDHVLIGEWAGDWKINLDEVSQLKWIDIDELELDMRENPSKYAVWFLSLAPKVIEYLKFKIS